MKNQESRTTLKLVFCLLALLFLLSSGCVAIITNRGPRVNVEPNPDQLQFRSLAVLPFSAPAGAAEAGWLVADEFARKLLAENLYQVVRKDLVGAALAEGNVDPVRGADVSDLRDVGRRLEVDAVLIGAINRYERYNKSSTTEDYHAAIVSLGAQLLDIQTGTILWDVTQTIQAERNIWTGDLPPTLEKLAQMAVAEMVLTLEVSLEEAQNSSVGP